MGQLDNERKILKHDGVAASRAKIKPKSWERPFGSVETHFLLPRRGSIRTSLDFFNPDPTSSAVMIGDYTELKPRWLPEGE